MTVIVGSTGLRFSQASAWYEKKYGKKAACTPWRMMHLAMDAEGDVLAVEITDTEIGDSSGLDVLLPQVGKFDRLIGDTAYYQIERNEQLLASGVVPVIPPKADAVDDPRQNSGMISSCVILKRWDSMHSRTNMAMACVLALGLDAGDRAQLPDNLRHYCRN